VFDTTEEHVLRVRARFLSKVRMPDGPAGCWLWTGAINSNGYGVFKLDWQGLSAHRASYIMFVDRGMPDDLQACHRCVNRRCVNPDHIYAGTAKQNREDITRTSGPLIDIDRMLALAATGLSKRAIARALGCSHTGVQKALVRHLSA
jgi:hypothetical protein